MNFYFDPFVFACDKNTITEDELTEFIEDLIDLKELVDLNWGQVYHSNDAYELLITKDLYPFYPYIKQLIDTFHINYIQPEEIDKIINSILNKTPTLDNQHGILDILYDISEHNIEDTSGRRDDDFSNSLTKLAVLIGIGTIISGKPQESNIIITKGLRHQTLKLSVELTIIELADKRPPPFSLPRSLNLDYLSFKNFHLFCSKISPVTIWMCAETNSCFVNSVYINLYQIDTSKDYIFGISRPNFTFQDSFFRSIFALNISRDKKIANAVQKALTEEILNLNNRATHELREDEGGNSKQIIFQEFGAWRRDIDYEFHLHYWRKGSLLKFADIVPHNIYAITRN